MDGACHPDRTVKIQASHFANVSMGYGGESACFAKRASRSRGIDSHDQRLLVEVLGDQQRRQKQQRYDQLYECELQSFSALQ